MAYSRGKRHLLVDQRIEIGFVLNASFAVLEIIVGIFSGSLALIADAGHNISDSISMVVSFVARRVAERSPNERKTFGYGRINIIAAAVNSFILIGVSVYVLYEAYDRFVHPHIVNGNAVAWVALIGIVINTYIAATFYRHRKDLNIKGLFLNMVHDALALFGTLIAGVLVHVTNNAIFDPIIGVVIGVMLLFSAWEIIWEAMHIFLESVPSNVNYFKVYRAIKKLKYVRGVDDVHIWAISNDLLALSCHVQLRKNISLETAEKHVEEIEEMLSKRFHIHHATIQLENEPCSPDKVHNTESILPDAE